jgi:hypothetical protein
MLLPPLLSPAGGGSSLQLPSSDAPSDVTTSQLAVEDFE